MEFEGLKTTKLSITYQGQVRPLETGGQCEAGLHIDFSATSWNCMLMQIKFMIILI